MWSLHLAMVSMRAAEMTSKICRNAPASLQVSHKKKKNRKQTLSICDAWKIEYKYKNYYEKLTNIEMS